MADEKKLTEVEGCGIMIMAAGCMMPIVIVVGGLVVLVISALL